MGDIFKVFNNQFFSTKTLMDENLAMLLSPCFKKDNSRLQIPI